MHEAKSGRTDVLVKKCRRRGGDCPCVGDRCEAIDAVVSETAELLQCRSRLTHLERQLERLQTPFAEFKEGWKPNPPDDTYRPVIFFDSGDGHFGYENGDGDFVDANEWPFDREYVWPDDCSRLGVGVI